MDIVSLVAAVCAVAISGVSVWYTRRSDRRAVRAEERAERAEERAVRAEARQEAEDTERRRARPVVTPGGISGGPTADQVRYEYKVHNVGNAPVIGLWLWHESEDGAVLSTGGGGQTFVIEPGGAHAVITVDVNTPRPTKQRLIVKWRDADGERQEFTGIEPPLHA